MRRTFLRLLLVSPCVLFLAALMPQRWAHAAEEEPTLATPLPMRWLPSRGNQCRKSKKKWKMCDGPRRTPEPYGQEAYLAEDLGLGTLKAAQRLLSDAPDAAWVEAVQGRASETMLWPVPGGAFGRGFGFTRTRRRGLRHDGVDIGAAVGEPSRAANDGVVAYSDNGVHGYGNMVMLVHKDASVTFYCHHRANYVFAGQHVRRGQVLGEVGTTGITRGPHLHFEYHVNGRARDPMPRMVGRPSRTNPLATDLLQL